MNHIAKIILAFVFTSALYLPIFKVSGETSLDLLCGNSEKVDERCENVSPAECRELLEQCLKYLEDKGIQVEKDIGKTKEEKKTLQSQISSLSRRISDLKYQIGQSSIVIKDIGFQIKDTKASIGDTSQRINDSKAQLALILRAIYEEEQKSIVEVFLQENQLSDFFGNLVRLENLSVRSKELLEDIKDMKSYLESQKLSLDEEKQGLENVMAVKTFQKEENERIKRSREYFLEMTEAEYQKYLKEKKEIEKEASEIEHRLFKLISVPEGGIEFGKAVEIAEYAETATGVRAAFLLSIIAQESMKQSKFGENVGQCYLKNSKTGDGVYIKTNNRAPRTMNPTRDVPHFLEIIQELNNQKGLIRDPYRTPVSCWISSYYQGKPYGWGGAMGPAQFIPSTWISYKIKTQAIIGQVPDPWDIKTAFLVSALHLKDLGAINNEWKAAMRYFSGNKYYPSEYYYGNQVIARAATFQREIDLLKRKR